MSLSITVKRLPLTGATMQSVEGTIETDQEIDMVLRAMGTERNMYNTCAFHPTVPGTEEPAFSPPVFGLTTEQLKGVYVHWGALVSS